MPFNKDCEKHVIELPNFKCKRTKFDLPTLPIISMQYQNCIILPTWTASCWSDAKLCCIDHRGHTKTTWTILWFLVATYLGPLIYIFKVENFLKGSLDSIPSPSPSLKIQIMGGKVCLRCKGKTLLGIVNKLFVFKSLLTSPSNVLPHNLK